MRTAIFFALLILPACFTLKLDKETEEKLEGTKKTNTVTNVVFSGRLNQATGEISGTIGVDSNAESMTTQTTTGSSHASGSGDFSNGLVTGMIPGGSGTLEIILAIWAFLKGKRKFGDVLKKVKASKPGQYTATGDENGSGG